MIGATPTRTAGSSRRSWDSSPATPPRPYQWLLVSIAVLALPPGLLATVLRLVDTDSNLAALLASFVSYGTIAYAVSAVLFTIAAVRARPRRVLPVLAVVSTALLGCHLAWLAPLFVADDRPLDTETISVLSLNLQVGGARSEQVVSEAATADIVVLVEATPGALLRLRDLGWDRRFPYSVGGPDDSRTGTAIYSRYPLDDETQLPPTSFEQRAATAAVPGLGPVRVVAVHPCNPFCGNGRWARDHEVVRSFAAAHRDLPLVLAGDFNAVADHHPMQRLRRDGLTSATDIVGAGWLPTYPANRLMPPTIPIDHILLSPELTATSVSTFAVAGTDHRGIRATIAGTNTG